MDQQHRGRFQLGVERYLNQPEGQRPASYFYGDQWADLPKGLRSTLGKQFKSAVIRGEFPGLRDIPAGAERNQRNHSEYSAE